MGLEYYRDEYLGSSDRERHDERRQAESCATSHHSGTIALAAFAPPPVSEAAVEAADSEERT